MLGEILHGEEQRRAKKGVGKSRLPDVYALFADEIIADEIIAGPDVL